jgi:hypothetical protein
LLSLSVCDIGKSQNSLVSKKISALKTIRFRL